MLYFYLFVYLMLAHLLADFVFQPKALVAWKHRSWKGVFVHSLVVLVMTMVMFWQGVAEGNVFVLSVLFGNAVLHFAMDIYKIREERKNMAKGVAGGRYVRLFILDQVFHVAVLVFVTYLLGSLGGSLSFTMSLDVFVLTFALYLIFAILITFVYEIVNFQFFRQRQGGTVMKFDYASMYMRFMILSLFFGIAMFVVGFLNAKRFF